MRTSRLLPILVTVSLSQPSDATKALENIRSVWSAMTGLMRSRSESAFDRAGKTDNDVLSSLSMPRQVKLVDGIITLREDESSFSTNSSVKKSIASELGDKTSEESVDQSSTDGLSAEQLRHLSKSLTVPRKVELVDGVLTEKERKFSDSLLSKLSLPKRVHSSDDVTPAQPSRATARAQVREVVSRLQKPRKLELVDGVFKERHEPAVHVSTSDSVLSKLTLPKRIHSSDFVAEMDLSVKSDRSPTPIVEDTPGWDLYSEAAESPKKATLTDMIKAADLVSNFQPNLWSDNERYGQGALLLLNPVLEYSTLTSVIFSAKYNPGLIVKYQVNCYEGGSNHPLLRDFWFLNRLSLTGIVPRVHAISRSSRMPEKLTFKTPFRLTHGERRKCVALRKNKVRYMIMDRVGASVFMMSQRYPDNVVPVDTVLRLGKRLIELLRQLHDEAGVIHGDIHGGNVCFDSDERDLKLIDFGRANLIEEGGNEFVRDPYSWTDPLLTHWNIAGYRETRRDDVMKALMLMATLMNGSKYVEMLSKLNAEESHQFKAEQPLFKVSDEKLKQSLEEILGIVRATKLDERPDYETVLSKLDEYIH